MTSPFQQQLPHEIFRDTGEPQRPTPARLERGGESAEADLVAEPPSREFIRQASDLVAEPPSREFIRQAMGLSAAGDFILYADHVHGLRAAPFQQRWAAAMAVCSEQSKHGPWDSGGRTGRSG